MTRVIIEYQDGLYSVFGEAFIAGVWHQQSRQTVTSWAAAIQLAADWTHCINQQVQEN
jgi:hypothetical protein